MPDEPATGVQSSGWLFPSASNKELSKRYHPLGGIRLRRVNRFPALAALISIYGFVVDPVTVADHVAYLGGLLPSGGLDLIRDQLQALAKQKPGALGTGFFIGLGIAPHSSPYSTGMPVWAANAVKDRLA